MRLKSFLLLICISLILFGGCKIRQYEGDVNIISLHQEYDILTDIDSDSDNWGYTGEMYFNEDGDLISQNMKFGDYKIMTMNVTQGKVIDSIDMNFYGYQYIEGFTFLSPDSILLAFNSDYMPNGYADNTLVIVNRNKEILETISMEGAPIKLKQNAETINRENRHTISHTYFPLVHKEGKIYLSTPKWSNRSKCNPNDSLIGIISHNPTAPFKRLPICFTCPPEGYFWSYDYQRPRGVWVDDYLYTFFGSEPILHQYNSKTEEIKKIEIPFSTIDPIVPYPDGAKDVNYDPYKSQYWDLFYLPAKKHFIWTARVACDSNDSPLASDIMNFVYSFVVFDTDFNKLGEGIMPEGFGWNITPYKEGFLLLKRGSENREYTYFTYSISEGKANFLTELINARRARMNEKVKRLPENEAFLQYFKELIGEKAASHQKFIIIPDASCPSCVPLYANILGTYTRKLNEKSIATILVNNIDKDNKKFLELINTAQKNSPLPVINESIPIYEDSKRLYQNYFDLWINLRYVEFDAQGKIIYNKIINPGDIQEFITKIAE